MSEVVQFSRPTKTQKSDKPMVRVIDVTSPFFTWEGWVSNVLASGEEGKQYVQIICAHSGFQFPALTFSVDQLAKVDK